MHYPIERICHFIRHTLKPAALCASQENGNTMLPTAKQLFGDTRLDLCYYIATANNVQQAGCMVYAIKVALHDLLHSLCQYSTDLQQPDTSGHTATALPDLYAFVTSETENLIVFLEENFSHLAAGPLPSFGAQQFNTNEQHSKRIVTNLSVPQLALFIRLLTDTGIIAEQHAVAVLANQTASAVQTRKAAQISAESLRIKYYSPERAAINILKEYVSQMMQLLRSY